MRKYILISWILFVLYTLYYVLMNEPNTTIFVDLLSFNANPFIFVVFNMLGIIPFLMILYVIVFEVKVNKFQKIGLGLSFMAGAFALYPTALFMGEPRKKKHRNWTKSASIITGVFILFLSLYGLLFGSLKNYAESFRNDAFVHIMTIDFFFLYIHSVMVAKKCSKKWYFALIPFIGFSYILYE